MAGELVSLQVGKSHIWNISGTSICSLTGGTQSSKVGGGPRKFLYSLCSVQIERCLNYFYIIIKPGERAENNDKCDIKGESFVKKISAFQTGNFKFLDSNSNSASGAWDKSLSFLEVEVILKVIPFQVLKFMISYSESCHNSFKTKKGKTATQFQLCGKLCLYSLQLWYLSC